MSSIGQSFFLVLGLYLTTFNTSPPHSFINDDSIPLQTKIVLMSYAIDQKTRMIV